MEKGTQGFPFFVRDNQLEGQALNSKERGSKFMDMLPCRGVLSAPDI